jgi:RNA polymerase sigma-70 factor (ECF subfamily)
MDDAPAQPEARKEAVPAAEIERDRALVREVQGGRPEAFDELVERHKSRVIGVLYNMLGNREDALDLAQEAFVKAFRSIAGFRNESSFYGWIYRIAINTALNFIRQRKDPHLSLNEWSADVEDDPAWRELVARESVQKDMDREELRERLNEALQKLSEEHRAVVVLHDIEGLRHQEIAKILGCTEATARSRLFYAHQQLQALLADYL